MAGDKIKKELLKAEAEVVVGKKVLKEEKSLLKKMKSRLTKENKKRALKVMELAVENIEKQRNKLEEEAVALAASKE
jgi:hypothetical protein